ncbi:MAG: hypothetical protein PVH37_15585 [Desulfobacterales bacterium]|jgi:peptide/nickel transport system substrate-binding protein
MQTRADCTLGTDVNLAVGVEWNDIVRYAEILKQDAVPVGIR